MNLDDIDIQEKKVITEDEMKNTHGIMYDVGHDEELTSLPNAVTILDDIIGLLECMNTEEMKILKETNQGMFEQVLEEKFPDFSYNYYSVFRMVLSGDDITPLFKMLEIISKVNTGESNIEDCEKDVGTYLSKFLPDGLLEKLESGQISPDDIHTPGENVGNKKNKNKKKYNKKYGK